VAPHIALVTVAAARHLDSDLPLIEAALVPRGARVSIVEWDDPSVDWSPFDLVCIRSTWDYQNRLPEFLGWVDHIGAVTTLVNPADVVRWNIDKRYLRDLAVAGIDVVPTTFVSPGQSFSIPAHTEVVVKPAVSAGANDTDRYRAEQAGEAADHVERLLAAGRTAMIQPYIASVDELGETGLVFFGGTFSHAFRKGPILISGNESVEGLYAAEDISPRRPDDDEMELANRVLDLIPEGRDRLAYARVDLVRGAVGPLVLELELTEPSVFLTTDPTAADRFAMVLAGFVD
jgi:hypothetical protein